MSDNLGAAPYSDSPPLSLWERVIAWWRSPLAKIDGYNAAVEQALGRPLAAVRVSIVDVPLAASDMLRRWDEDEAAHRRYLSRLKVEA